MSNQTIIFLFSFVRILDWTHSSNSKTTAYIGHRWNNLQAPTNCRSFGWQQAAAFFTKSDLSSRDPAISRFSSTLRTANWISQTT